MSQEQDPIDETLAADTRLADILDRYMEDCRRGIRRSHDEVMAENPELRDSLKSCLDGIDMLCGPSLGPAPAALNQGQTIGDFELKEEIGRGGMGVVYLAHQKSLDREVALKILNLPTTDRVVMDRFQREAETAAGLHHTNIVPIYAVGNDGTTHYYAMQYIQGASLGDKIQDGKGPFDLDDVAQWGLQAADALAHAHQRGVIHRDIKPSNLIMDPDGQIWLTDFGLARRMDDVRLSITGAVLGTPRYMSPEQASVTNAPVDARSDIYSLGATLFELACGRPAVDGENPASVIRNILRGEKTSPTALREDMTRDFETVLLRCLETVPEDRYETAAELADDLRALVDGRDIRSRRPPVWERARRWFHRNASHVRSASVGAVAVITLALAVFWVGVVYPTLDDATVRMSSTGGEFRTTLHRADGGDSPSVTMPVPSDTAVTMDRGTWRGQLIKPGTFSRLAEFNFDLDRPANAVVKQPDAPLWTAENVIHSRPMAFNGHTDVLVVTPMHLKRLNGRDGHVVWETLHENLPITFREGKSTLGGLWGMLHASPRSTYQSTVLMQIPDINDDGHADVLIGSTEHPALLALSGIDGTELWIQYYAEMVKVSPGAHMMQCVEIRPNPGQSGTVLIALAGESHDAYWTGSVRLADGKMLWATQCPQMPPREHAARLSAVTGYTGLFSHARRNSYHNARSAFFEREDTRPNWIGRDIPIAPLDLSEKSSHWLSGDKLYRLGLVDGSVELINELPTPNQPIQTVRLPGGQFGRLAVSQPGDAESDKETMSLELWSDDFQTLRWSCDLVADHYSYVSVWSERPSLPMVVDLNADGIDEIVTQWDRDKRKNVYDNPRSPWASLQILKPDGSGQYASPVKLPTGDLHIQHVVVVNDQDGDGWRDFAIASRYMSTRDRIPSVHIDLVSSQSGKTLWHRTVRQTDPEELQRPPEIHRFDRIETGGREMLLLCDVHLGAYSLNPLVTTQLLDATSGDQISIGEKLAVEAMWQSEGAEPVFWARSYNRALSHENTSAGSTYHAIALPPHEALMCSQSVQIKPDFDGDDVYDLKITDVSGMTLYDDYLASGASGKKLFSSTQPGDRETIEVAGDLTGNGCNDLLQARTDGEVTLVEGGRGTRLWNLGLYWDPDDVQCCSVAKLRPGERRDLVLIADGFGKKPFGTPSWEVPLSVVGVSGSDGSVLWKNTLVPVNQRVFHQLQDVTGDKIDDVVLAFTQREPVKTHVMVIDGKDGQAIWQTTFKPNRQGNYVPKFSIAQVGKEKRIVWFSYPQTPVAAGRLEFRMLDALTGQLVDSKLVRTARSYMHHGWDWKFDSQYLVRMGSANQAPRFATWVYDDHGERKIHVYDLTSEGIVEVGTAFTLPDQRTMPQGMFRLVACDVDDDGNDELLVPVRTGVACYDINGKLIWKQTFGKTPQDADDFALEVVRDAGEVTECIVRHQVPRYDLVGNWSQQDYEIVALDVTDGALRWRVRGEKGMALARSHSIGGLLDPNAPLPSFIYIGQNDLSWTRCRAEPIAADLLSLSEKAAPASPTTAASTESDMRWLDVGPYPGGAGRYFEPFNHRLSGGPLWPTAWSIFGFILPTSIAVALIRRKRFSMLQLLWITAVVAGVMAVYTIPVGARPYSAFERFGLGFMMLPILILPLAVMYLRKRGHHYALFLCLPIIFLVGYELLKLATGSPTRIVLASDILSVWRGLPVTLFIGGLLAAFGVFISAMVGSGRRSRRRTGRA